MLLLVIAWFALMKKPLEDAITNSIGMEFRWS
jgi:hypothetical protein